MTEVIDFPNFRAEYETALFRAKKEIDDLKRKNTALELEKNLLVNEVKKLKEDNYTLSMKSWMRDT